MTEPAARKHLGKGWGFPIRPDDQGRLRHVAYEEAVEQSIGLVLETARGERVMNPGFGTGLRAFVFDSTSSATCRSIEAEVAHALVEWEPRISVESVRAEHDPTRPSLVSISIDYVVRRSNAFYNLVLPFYLSEGV